MKVFFSNLKYTALIVKRTIKIIENSIFLIENRFQSDMVQL